MLDSLEEIYFQTDGLQTRFEKVNEGSLVLARKKDVKANYRFIKRKKSFKREIVLKAATQSIGGR